MIADSSVGARAWLAKAWNDLRSAKTLAGITEPILDTAIYHCQQAAEKALKSYLCYKGSPIARTHDLVRLLALASSFEAHFDSLQDAADVLAPFAVSFRYPDESEWNAPIAPEQIEFDEALAAAQHIYDFVLSLLPSETHPQ